jgi:hypothetical protein
LYEEIQLVEVELLPTFIVYRKSELLSPQRSKVVLDAAFKFTNLRSGFVVHST